MSYKFGYVLRIVVNTGLAHVVHESSGRKRNESGVRKGSSVERWRGPISNRPLCQGSMQCWCRFRSRMDGVCPNNAQSHCFACQTALY